MIRLENISFSYPNAPKEQPPSLQNISLTIDSGERIAVMGQNGSGKTTFARCLNGLYRPTSGSLTIDELDLFNEDHLWDIRRRIGMVFQNPDNQIVSATVEREIAFGLENIGTSFEDMQRIVEKSLKKFKLYRYRRHSPHYLSGGEKQRLAIAAVMAMNPSYLVLDEPTSLLDPMSRQEILHTITQLHQTYAMTTILITQFPQEALDADRLIVFHDGEILFDDHPKQVFSHRKELQRIGLDTPISIQLEEFLYTRKN